MKSAIVFDGEDEITMDTREIQTLDAETAVKLFKATAVYRAASIEMLNSETDNALKGTPAEGFVAARLAMADRGYNFLIGRLMSLFGEGETLRLIATVDLDIKLAN
jgi:hypothetical protein